MALFADMLSLPNDGRYPKLELTPEQRRQRTLEALVWQMEALARQNSVLMIFEDAHWTDPTSLELFGRIVDRIPSLPVLLIVTFRPEFESPWIGRPHVTALTINRLAQRDIEAMIERVVGNKPLPARIGRTSSSAPMAFPILGLRRAGTDHTVWLKALSDLLESYLWLTCKRDHLHKSMDTLQHSMEGIEDDAATLLMDGYATFVAVLDAKLVIEAFDRSLDFLIGQNAQEELEFAYQDENRRRERQAALDAYARAIRVLVQCAPACDSERIGRAAALLISLNRSYRPQTDNLAVLACALSDPQRLRLASTLRQQGQVDDGQITLLLQLAMRMQSLEDRKAQYAGAIEFLKTSEHRTKEWFVIQIAKEHMASLDEPSLTHLAELLLTYRYSRALVTAVLPSFRRLTAFMRNAVYEKVFAAGDAYGRFIIGCAFHGEANALNSASLISELLTFIRALWPSTLAIEAVTEVFAHVTVPKAAGVAFLETALELARGIHDYESVTHSFARTAAYADDQERSPLLIAPPICTGVLGIVLRESEMRKSVFVKLREVWKSRLPDRPVRSKSRSITELPSELLHDVKDAQLAKKLLEMLRETVDLETRSVLFSFIADYGQEFSLRGYRTIALEAAFAMHDCYRWWP